MFTDAKRFVEPWNNNSFRSSNSTTMSSGKNRCFDYNQEHASMKFPEAYGNKATFRVDRIQQNHVASYKCDENEKNHYTIFGSEHEKEPYYDIHSTEQTLSFYRYQESKSCNPSMNYHSKVSSKVSSDAFFDHSPIAMIQDIPEVMESESSSWNSSVDCSNSMVSNDRKSNGRNRVKIEGRAFNGYHNEYNEGYEERSAAKYNPTTYINTGMQNGAVGAISSHAPNHKKEVKAGGATKCKMIEIAPGEFMRLRGAHETWMAIQNDFYLPCACFCCDLTLFCIQDATYVLCPVCQVVNPLEKIDGYDGGVGLGFTIEELAEWQNDIVTERRY